MAAKKSIGDKIREAVAEIEGNLATIRAEVAKLKGRRQEILDAPVTKSIALARLETRIAATAAAFDPEGILARDLVRRESSDGKLELAEVTIMSHYSANNLNEMLCAIFPDQIREALAKRIETEYADFAAEGVEAIGDEARSREIAEIDRRLVELETSEEEIRATAANAGFTIEPRADLDPVAFLEVEA